MIERILNAFKKRVLKRQFDRTAAKILETRKCEYTSSESFELIIVSQVYSAALCMTIVALKSFIHRLGLKIRLDLIDDGSLTNSDKAQLRSHFPSVNIIAICSVDLKGCPSGGTWERLSHILQSNKNHYVIQVDTDTLTLNDVDEVMLNISRNTAFTIGGPPWSEPVSPAKMAEIAKSWTNTHVQSSAESLFDNLNSINLNSYYRGCSAFTGFPKGIELMQSLIDFSDEMILKLGKDKWNEWGSEQLSCNVIISLIPDSSILPWPKYQNYGFPFTNSQQLSSASVIHFLGTHRYKGGTYEKFCRQIVASLK